MYVKEGLSYMKIRPVRDEEWDKLPQTIMTKDAEWDPRVYDDGVNSEWWDKNKDSVKKHYENLHGMSVIGSEKDVVIVRPLLEVPKPAIYEFAAEYLVPHLYDSTPDWSMRGQLRNLLIPTFDRIDRGFMPAFSHLSEMLGSMYRDTLAAVRLMFELYAERDGHCIVLNIGQHPS